MAAAAEQLQHADAAAVNDRQSSSDSDTLVQNNLLPLLVFHRRKHDMLILSVSEDQILLHKKNLDDHYGLLRQPGNLYWSTPQGWMLIMEYPAQQEEEEESAAAYLWDPRTGGKLPLPNLQVRRGALRLSKCLLTRKDPAAHPGCVVVLLLQRSGDETAMWWCRTAGGGGWRRCSYDINHGGLPISVVAACQGKLYFAGSRETMGTVDFEGHHPVFQYFQVPSIRFPHGMSPANRWLVESNDQLYLVYIFSVGDWIGKLGTIRAYKMDLRVWRRVHDIGDAVIFLDRLHRMGAATPLGLKPNQVYFTRNDCNHDGAYLRAFDLGTDIMDNTWVPDDNSLRRLTPFWIVPPIEHLAKSDKSSRHNGCQQLKHGMSEDDQHSSI